MNLERAQNDFIDRALGVLNYAYSAGGALRVLEYYRTPERQNELQASGHSHARAWESPHQYGLAVDVAFDPQGYDVPKSWWTWLSCLAKYYGLVSGASWGDYGHIQYPNWRQYKWNNGRYWHLT